MPNEQKAAIDFETRSACAIRKGTWAYSTHPSTEVLCLVYRLPHWPKGQTGVWHPAIPSLALGERVEDSLSELLEWVDAGGLVEAHNVWFEYCTWNNILVSRYGWPVIPLVSWRCSAAKAATHSMHRDLDKAASALKLPFRKDLEGSKVMKKMAKPRKSRKAERLDALKSGVPLPKILYHESIEMHDVLIAYCRQDVLTEEALSHALPDLNVQETQMFLMDLRMNSTGFQLDRDAVNIALKLIHREGILLNQELTLLTDRRIKKATQRPKLLLWLEENGLLLPNTQKGTLDDILEERPDMTGFVLELSTLQPKVRRALEIMRALGRSSTAKYTAMRDWAGKDWRIRGGLLYHGASTGRWSGKGIQPHNFPRGSKDAYGDDIDMEVLWEVLKTCTREDIANAYNSVMEALANALRGAIIPSKGQQLFVADYASIEARVLLWCADDQDGMNVFRQGGDMYCYMAESIYGYPCTKKANPDERALGKVAVLGLGYQMGAARFVGSCADANPPIIIEEDFAKTVVDAYRTKFWRVKNLWYEQEAAAIQATETGKAVRCGKVVWRPIGKFLYCELPSGRRLAYPYPEVKLNQTSWGEMKPQLSFMGVHPKTHKWVRLTTYGGMIVENIVQAISRDIMAEAMLRAQDTSDYRVLLSVHDELIAETPLGTGDVRDFEALLTKVPTWAPGCPIGAEGWRGLRYRK